MNANNPHGISGSTDTSAGAPASRPSESRQVPTPLEHALAAPRRRTPWLAWLSWALLAATVVAQVVCLALALPIVWTIVEMMLLAQVSAIGRMGLSICLMLVFYSFGENLEILSYLFWPSSVLLGIALAGTGSRELAVEPATLDSAVAAAGA